MNDIDRTRLRNDLQAALQDDGELFVLPYPQAGDVLLDGHVDLNNVAQHLIDNGWNKVPDTSTTHPHATVDSYEQ